jgi:hypothetical protein
VKRRPFTFEISFHPSAYYTLCGMVLCIARQGIHFLFMNPLYGEQQMRGIRFSIDMNALTGNAQNHPVFDIITFPPIPEISRFFIQNY